MGKSLPFRRREARQEDKRTYRWPTTSRGKLVAYAPSHVSAMKSDNTVIKWVARIDYTRLNPNNEFDETEMGHGRHMGCQNQLHG